MDEIPHFSVGSKRPKLNNMRLRLAQIFYERFQNLSFGPFYYHYWWTNLKHQNEWKEEERRMKEEPLNFLSILQKKEKDRIFHFLQIDGLFAHDEKRETMRFQHS